MVVERCTDELLWYHDLVGHTFPIIREEEEFFWTVEPEGYLNFIYKEDCRVVKSYEQ